MEPKPEPKPECSPLVALPPITISPIGLVRTARAEPIDDHWGGELAIIELDSSRFTGEALAGLSDFSHLEVVYFFHLVSDAEITTGARHPRNNPSWPRVGIFAQRGKARPSRLGVSRCQLLGVDGLQLKVRGLDAISGTPVLDIKPYMREFGPQGEVRQPEWATEIMREYY